MKKHAVAPSVKKKRKRSCSISQISDLKTLFALLLASLSTQPQTTLPFVNKCLFKFRNSPLISKSSITPILAILPTLLSSTHSNIARRAANIIGAASLVSLEINEEIASDSQTVKGLISLLESSDRDVMFSACNAVLDLSITTFAQQQLLSFSALHKLMWEGIVHFALHCWSENWKSRCCDAINSLSQKLVLVSVNLLHVAIGIISTTDPNFRKACLTAAVSLPSDVYNRLTQNQRKTFLDLIDKIHNECKFSEVLSNVEVAIQKNKDPFAQIRWLWVLSMEKEANNGYTDRSFIIDDLRLLCANHKDELEAAFLKVKSMFSSEVVFDDIVTSHGMLLQRFKKTRRQYINGMISLHDRL